MEVGNYTIGAAVTEHDEQKVITRGALIVWTDDDAGKGRN